MTRYITFVGVNDGAEMSVQIYVVDASSEESAAEVVTAFLDTHTGISRVTDVLVYEGDVFRDLTGEWLCTPDLVETQEEPHDSSACE